MINSLMQTLMRASGLVFLIEVALSGALLLLAIATFQIVNRLKATEPQGDEKESLQSFAQWGAKLFAKMTIVRVAWAILAYAGFRVGNLPEGKSRLMIIGVILLTLTFDFLDSVYRIIRGKARTARE